MRIAARSKATAALSALLVVTFSACASSAQAASFNVNRTDDPGIVFPGPFGCAGAALDCSLRQAIQNANATPGSNTVSVPPGTYTLTIAPVSADDNSSGDLNITNTTGTTSIVGTDPNTTIVQAGTSPATSIDRVFRVEAGANASISGLTIQFGQAKGSPTPAALGNSGGGILDLGTLALANDVVTQNRAATGAGAGGGGVRFAAGPPSTLTIDGSTLTMNQAGDGGGIVEDLSNTGITPPSGTVTITRTTIANNSAGFGGGVSEESGGTINIAQSTIHGNTSTGGGGGVVQNGGGPVSITQSTLDANTAQYGGAIDEESGNPPPPSTAPAIMLINDTISGNRAVGPGGTNVGGGGIDLNGGGTAVIVNSTISGNSTANASAGNTQGGNIHDDGVDPVNLTNTILSGGSPANCQSTTTNQFFSSGSHGRGTANGHNLSNDSTCALSAANGDVFPVDPLLGPLGDNGGPTFTRALLAGSSAIDAGTDAACPPTDQRGVPRPQPPGGRCDVGAFEFVFPAPTPIPTPARGGVTAMLPSPPPVLACVANKLILTDVFPRAGRTQFLGVAPPAASGKQVTILSTWNHKPVATATVKDDLTFTASAALPPRSLRSTNRARYVAEFGSQSSLALKFFRRLLTTDLAVTSKTVIFSGRVVPPLAKPIKPVLIRASASCSTIQSGTVVATVKPSRAGTFTASFPIPSGLAGARVVYLRAETKVRTTPTSRKQSATFSLIRAFKTGI